MASLVRLPLIKEIAVPPDPMALLEKIMDKPFCFLLDSSMEHQDIGRYSFLGCDPFLVLKIKGRNLELVREGLTLHAEGNPFQELRRLQAQYSMPGRPGLPPFWGGAVGYFSYDLGQHLEQLPSVCPDDLGLPDLYLGFYDTVVIVDHNRHKVYLSSTGFPEATGTVAAVTRARERLSELDQRLSSRSFSLTGANPTAPVDPQPVTSNFTQEEYCTIVQRAKDYIAAGDIFQVNLSQRLTRRVSLPPWQLYKRLRMRNPAPFAAYLDLPEATILSSSPERYLKLEGDLVETRPIKGTRPRGSNQRTDLALRQELWTSDKDRAELLMIVDLERNDLGRVCRFGTVQVPELFRLEAYSTVFHLVSTVVGQLEPGKNIIDLLEATFPGGSITGAPKIRSMEIIEELETVKRGIYTGSIGYIGANGDADLNIVIRTILIKDRQSYFQVGGGIVADSDPEKEYQETLDKAKALLEALQTGPPHRFRKGAQG
ncbi:MAG: aminodeoxychorismate synthase, component I [Bacillota bacterium]